MHPNDLLRKPADAEPATAEELLEQLLDVSLNQYLIDILVWNHHRPVRMALDVIGEEDCIDFLDLTTREPVLVPTHILKKFDHALGEQFLGEEALKRANRNFVSDTYEAVQWYCNLTQRGPLLASTAWNPMLRLLRNKVSHGRSDILSWPTDWNKPGKLRDSVQFEGFTITRSQAGKPLVYPAGVLLKLWLAVRAWAETLPASGKLVDDDEGVY